MKDFIKTLQLNTKHFKQLTTKLRSWFAGLLRFSWCVFSRFFLFKIHLETR
jgi:hypothetical protein